MKNNVVKLQILNSERLVYWGPLCLLSHSSLFCVHPCPPLSPFKGCAKNVHSAVPMLQGGELKTRNLRADLRSGCCVRVYEHKLVAMADLAGTKEVKRKHSGR